MVTRQKLAGKIKEKEAEVQSLENDLREARAYLQALKDTLRLFPKEGATLQAEQILRPGSEMAKARDAIRNAQRPLHIAEIIQAIGKENTKKTRVSVAGSLASYVRKGQIFTRPAPNTFGLFETEESSGKGEES